MVSISTTNDQSEDIGKISPEPRLKISILVFSLISSRDKLENSFEIFYWKKSLKIYDFSFEYNFNYFILKYIKFEEDVCREISDPKVLWNSSSNGQVEVRT